MSLSVCIISYRNPTYLDLCLKSATENKVLSNTQILVVLDGYAEESEEVIRKYPGIDAVVNETNLGQSISHNTAVYMASGEYIVVLNDDNCAPAAWDERLMDIATPNSVISPNQCEPKKSIFKSFIHKDFGTTPETFRYEEFMDWERMFSTPRFTPDGYTWPLFTSKKNYMKVGGIDTQYPHPSHADHDLFNKFQLCDLEIVRAHHLHFYHFARRSEGGGEKEKNTAMYYQWKWGFDAFMDEDNSHLPKNQVIRGISY